MQSLTRDGATFNNATPAALLGFTRWLTPAIVWLGLGELTWLVYWFLRPATTSPAFTVTVVGWVAVMLLWLAAVMVLGTRGFFLAQSRRLSNMVGVMFVVAVSAGWFAATGVGQIGILAAAAAVPDVQMAGVHILRLLAVGTVVKYVQRQLPLHFVLLGSMPDVLFAVSAVVVTTLTMAGPLPAAFLLVWHTVGILVFFGAGVSMFFSVPSPLRLFHTQPDASLVFRFPMVLAPNFTVPLFIVAHLFAIAGLLVR